MSYYFLRRSACSFQGFMLQCAKVILEQAAFCGRAVENHHQVACFEPHDQGAWLAKGVSHD